MKGQRFWWVLGLSVTLLALSGLVYVGRLSSKVQAAPLDAISASPSMGSAHFGLNWDVFGTGGSEISSAHFRVAATMGQPAVGNIDSAHFAAHIGYWQNESFSGSHYIYLPLVMRNP